MLCDLCGARTPMAAVGDGFPRPFLSVIIIQHLFRVGLLWKFGIEPSYSSHIVPIFTYGYAIF